MHSRNVPMARLFYRGHSKCPVFHNTNLRIPGSFCLHVAVTKLHDKFTSLQQENSPNRLKISFKHIVPTCIWYNF